MQSLFLYAKPYHEDEETGEITYPDKRGYILMEGIQEWKSHTVGLEYYIDEKSLSEVVKFIHYRFEDGMIEFHIEFNKGYNEDSIITYHNKEVTIREAMIEYLVGQVNDGWGEGGVFLQDIMNVEVKLYSLEWNLYKKTLIKDENSLTGCRRIYVKIEEK